MHSLGPRILFITKERPAYWGNKDTSSGLKNSVNFLVDMLVALGIDARVVEVVDNNGIDAAVAQAQPSHVIVEALWVVPDKFSVLRRLHPRVHWAVRLHSNAPFLANEGIALEWIRAYLDRGIEVICNAPDALADVRILAREIGVSERLASYGPNYYPLPPFLVPHSREPDIVRIGCFGAIRPLKNQLAQAVAALRFAHATHMRLQFYMNVTRVEGKGEPVLRNLQALLGDQLISTPWCPHDDFLAVLAGMDLSLQVSLTETFNIVAADSVAVSVPVVVSREIAWLGHYAQVDTDAASIAHGMLAAWQQDPVARAHRQRRDLTNANSEAQAEWLDRFGQ